MRFRITVRNEHLELRGYMDAHTEHGLELFAEAMKPYGLVVASPAADDYNPFALSEPDFPPTLNASIGLIQDTWDASESPEDFLAQIAALHYAQAIVIRGERGRAERAEKELALRELHHFETEEENSRLKAAARRDAERDARMAALIKAVKESEGDSA